MTSLAYRLYTLEKVALHREVAVIPPPLPAEPIAEVVAGLLTAGYTDEQIAAAIGRPAGLIEVLPWMRWISPATAHAVALAEGIRQMRAAGVPRDQITARLGTDLLTVRRVTRALPASREVA